MKRSNLLLPLVTCLFVGLGCGSSSSQTSVDKEGYSPDVTRGRLKFAKSVTALNIGRDPIFRDVKQGLYIDGKQWAPPEDHKFADKINWCDTSPNPNVEILRCLGDASEDYKTTYILRIKNDKPEIQKIDEGLPNGWINDDGRWLLFSKLFLNVETGETIKINAPSPFNQEESSVLPLYLLGVSPDMKTIIQLPDKTTQKEDAEEFLTIWIIDTETGKLEKRKVSATKYPWLEDYKQPENNIQPPPEPGKKFVWEKGADGKDKLVVPQLLEKIETKRENP